MSARVAWDGGTDRIVLNNMKRYGDRVIEVIGELAEFYAPQIEGYAKDTAPWTDQTGNARQGLWCDWRYLDDEKVEIVLGHLMEYGLYLEVRFQGAFAVILPTLETYYPDIANHLEEIFS